MAWDSKSAKAFTFYIFVIYSWQALCFAKPASAPSNNEEQQNEGHIRRRRNVADLIVSDTRSRMDLQNKRRQLLSFLLNVAESSSTKGCYCPRRNSPCACAVRKAYNLVLDHLNGEASLDNPEDKMISMVVDQLPAHLKAALAEHIVRLRNEKIARAIRSKRRYLRHVNYLQRKPVYYHTRRQRGKQLLSW